MDREEKQRLIRRLTQAFNRIDGAYYYCARRLGVEENTLELLYALDDGRPHSQKQVCEEWLIPKTTINTIVHRMQQQGYLTLRHGDGREKTICLTPAGVDYARTILKDVYAAESAALEAMLAKFSAEFISVYEAFADELCAQFRARMPQNGRQRGTKD